MELKYFQWMENILKLMLLIVLNGIEIQMDNTQNRKTNAFNRTKWN